ncbi:MAG: hypothetical protein NWE92_07910 [Candidatus Bathyarchaeota archaeon]|nr:hypothetical protein [Candidatus Bathyarchaeota archaeon]
MSASELESEWNFRVFDQRLIVIRTKSEAAHKAAALDVKTNLLFALEVTNEVPIDKVALNHPYMANLRVYTIKKVGEVDDEFIDFFRALDIDQSTEDFIRAYWIYPGKIRFELVDIQEP